MIAGSELIASVLCAVCKSVVTDYIDIQLYVNQSLLIVEMATTVITESFSYNSVFEVELTW
jgi:hypothetical protein